MIELAIKTKYVKEERDTPLVESYNQQHVFIWARNNLNLSLGQVHVLHSATEPVLI